MSGPKSLLLYQEQPSGILLKILFSIVPILFMIIGIYLLPSGDPTGGAFLLAFGLIIAAVLFLIFPRKYQVYEDSIRIVLGGPLAITIRFDRIKNIEVTNRTAMTANFVTRITKRYTLITTNGSLGFAITPTSNEVFVENAKQAMAEWARTHIDRRKY